MLKNYIKVALRSFMKQKLYAFINIFGLALGLAFCCIIAMYVRHELSFDDFHKDSALIHRVNARYYYPDGSIEDYYDDVAMPVGPALKADLPEVAEFVRFLKYDRFVKSESNLFNETLLFTDPSFLDVFSFPLLFGDQSTALSSLNNVLLSETAALKYFGTRNAIGERLSIRLKDSYQDFFVTGILRDAPSHSSIDFSIVLPFMNNSQSVRMAGQWGSDAFPTYVKLIKEGSASSISKKLPAWRARYFPDEAEELTEEGYPPGQVYGEYLLQPLEDVRLDAGVESDFVNSTNPMNLYILSGIALAILLIACINFMTLAIGRSAKRSREVGVRKIVGARKSQLMIQFWGEAILMSILALLLSFLLIGFLLPVFNELIGQNLDTTFYWGTDVLTTALSLMLFTGLIAGSYPAIVLSNSRPIDAIKNKQKLGGANFMTRSLVTFQFSISVFLMISTFVMLQQLDHVNAKDLGYNKEQVVIIPVQGLDGKKTFDFFKNNLSARGDIAGISGINNSFERGYWAQSLGYKGETKEVYVYSVAEDFLDVMQMKLTAGRDFRSDFSSDFSSTILINEALAKEFGWTSPIGETLPGFLSQDLSSDPVVAGVVQDFNFRSLHQKIEPAVIFLGGIRNLLVRIQADDISSSLAFLEDTWKAYAPDVPFSYSFLDDDLASAYQNEQRWSKVIGYSSCLAILVACMGLFGLASLTVNGRTKEIGIRKILGASVISISTLVSKEFARLVLIGVILGVPLAYFAMDVWLRGFAYKITLTTGVFFVAGALALSIAIITVSYQSIGIALTNPVTSIRQE